MGGTASAGVSIERDYLSEHVKYQEGWAFAVTGSDGIAGITDPILAEPIDFDAEIAERRETHEPLQPVETDPTNPHFGI